MFVRMNRSKSSCAQENSPRKFQGSCLNSGMLGKWDFWRRNRVFTPHQLRRMRAVELLPSCHPVLEDLGQEVRLTCTTANTRSRCRSGGVLNLSSRVICAGSKGLSLT